jgi:hypothetical protein
VPDYTTPPHFEVASSVWRTPPTNRFSDENHAGCHTVSQEKPPGIFFTTTMLFYGVAKGATVTLVVDGGTGAYANARGYGHLQPISTGSNVTLNLTS